MKKLTEDDLDYIKGCARAMCFVAITSGVDKAEITITGLALNNGMEFGDWVVTARRKKSLKERLMSFLLIENEKGV